MQWRRELTWNPGDLRWRIAVMFMIGAFLFALGSFPPYSQLVDSRAVGITFVAGSLVFTTAGYSVFFHEINVADDASSNSPGQSRLWAWQPHNIGWWSAFVQLIGTLLFNLNTIDAMVDTFTVEEGNRLVWAPDFLGSIAFLVASHLAWLVVCRRLWCVRRDDADWWGALLNYIGSIFFLASAFTSFTLETTGEVINTTIVNVGTSVGSVCFFFGAYLLLPAAGAGRRGETTNGSRAETKDVPHD